MQMVEDGFEPPISSRKTGASPLRYSTKGSIPAQRKPVQCGCCEARELRSNLTLTPGSLAGANMSDKKRFVINLTNGITISGIATPKAWASMFRDPSNLNSLTGPIPAGTAVAIVVPPSEIDSLEFDLQE
jgi:hypothetical protein